MLKIARSVLVILSVIEEYSKVELNEQSSLEWWQALLPETQCLHEKWFWTDEKQKYVG